MQRIDYQIVYVWGLSLAYQPGHHAWLQVLYKKSWIFSLDESDTPDGQGLAGTPQGLARRAS